MLLIRKYCLCLAITAMLFIFPDKLLCQWYGESAYRFGVNSRTSSSLEIAQTDVTGAMVKPYTLGGYAFSTGYTFRPDSLNVAYSTGVSYLKSHSGNFLFTSWPYYPAYMSIKHDLISADLGLSFEFKIKKINSSSGIVLMLPVYMKGMEIQPATTWNLNEIRRGIYYRWGPGIRIHQDFSLWTNRRTTFFAGVSAGWISAWRKSRNLLNGDPSVPASKRVIQYLTDRQISEKGKINDPSLSGFDPKLPIETATYNEPLSFVALKMGLTFYLQKKN